MITIITIIVRGKLYSDKTESRTTISLTIHIRKHPLYVRDRGR